jgi:hypothetical protein
MENTNQKKKNNHKPLYKWETHHITILSLQKYFIQHSTLLINDFIYR